MYSKPQIDALEPRLLFSVADLTGEYLAGPGGVVYELNLKHLPGDATSYTGNLTVAGVVSKITATENSSSLLRGTATPSKGAAQKFAASLAGNLLTVVLGTKSTKLTQISTTPAPSPSALANHTGTAFSYKAPKGWLVSDGTPGIVILSPDKTQQVVVRGGVENAIVGVGAVITSEQNAGDTFISQKTLANGWISSAVYLQEELDKFTYNHAGVAYQGVQLVTTLINYDAGKYNAASKTFSGQTLTLLSLIAAPQNTFTAQSPTLFNIVNSIKPLGNGVGSSTLTFPLLTPGTKGNWFTKTAFNYSNDPWLKNENTYLTSAAKAQLGRNIVSLAV